MLVRFSGWVETDLEDIAAYIGQHNPVRAASFIDDLRREFIWIGLNPEIYRLRPEIGSGARLATVGKYLILFRILHDEVEIGRVYHGARKPPSQTY